MKLSLDRRSFLRGAVLGAAACLALPPLEIMLNSNGTAYADGTPFPKRFGIFFWGNGVVAPHWVPTQTGLNWTPGEALQPLAAAGLKDYINVVSGHDIKTGNPRGHHAGAVGILSGAPLIPQDPGNAGFASTFSTASIDQVIASHIGGSTRFRSLEFGVDPRVSRSEGTTLHHLSHNGPDNVNPAEYNPHNLFTRLFGDGFVETGTPERDPRLALRRHILDAVREDAHALQRKLGAQDRARLDQHLEGIGALQQRLRSIEEAPAPPSACTMPINPGEIGHDTEERQRQRSRAMADLLAIALACDQTRVWSNLFNGSVSGTIYWGIDPTTNFHQLTHDEPGDQPKVHAIVRFIMGEFAYLLGALRDTPEGDGNLLDNSVILATSDCTSGYRHNITDYPILLAGRGGGSLNTGLHVRGNRSNASNVLLTCMRAMECPGHAFGTEGGYTEQGVSELEA